MVAEAAFLCSTEVQLGAGKLLSTGSDAKVSTASFISIQRCRLVYHHVAMMVQYIALNRNLISWRSIFNHSILRNKPPSANCFLHP